MESSGWACWTDTTYQDGAAWGRDVGKEKLRGNIMIFSNSRVFWRHSDGVSNKQLDLGKCGALRKAGSALMTLKVMGHNINGWARGP